jgi:hypothetical protein
MDNLLLGFADFGHRRHPLVAIVQREPLNTVFDRLDFRLNLRLASACRGQKLIDEIIESLHLFSHVSKLATEIYVTLLPVRHSVSPSGIADSIASAFWMRDAKASASSDASASCYCLSKDTGLHVSGANPRVGALFLRFSGKYQMVEGGEFEPQVPVSKLSETASS